MSMVTIDDISKKVDYLVDIPLMINANITEYDISKANINMLLSYGLISKEEYDRYYNMDKLTREISIGRRMRNDDEKFNSFGKSAIKVIQEGIYKAKYTLLETNHVQVEDIIRIANDAIYINKPNPLQFTDFDINNNGVNIHFKTGSIYNIMLNLNMVTIFIYDNPMTDELNIDVKGINDKLLYKHEALLGFICNIITDMQRSGKESVLYVFNDFYEKYINLALPVEYYREFNHESSYRIKGPQYINILSDNISPNEINTIDIGYNLAVLRQLYSIILNF